MARKITWSHLPVSLPEGVLSPQMSAKLRTEIIDATFDRIGGADRLADWAGKPENYGDFVAKIWAKGAARPQQVEHSASDSVEELIRRLDAGEHARVIDAEILDNDR